MQTTRKNNMKTSYQIPTPSSKVSFKTWTNTAKNSKYLKKQDVNNSTVPSISLLCLKSLLKWTINMMLITFQSWLMSLIWIRNAKRYRRRSISKSNGVGCRVRVIWIRLYLIPLYRREIRICLGMSLQSFKGGDMIWVMWMRSCWRNHRYIYINMCIKMRLLTLYLIRPLWSFHWNQNISKQLLLAFKTELIEKSFLN